MKLMIDGREIKNLVEFVRLARFKWKHQADKRRMSTARRNVKRS